MKIAGQILLFLLVLLALASGLAKVMLAPRDVEFFGHYGFGAAALAGFGAAQVAGGLLMAFGRTRLVGSLLVAITFLVSGALLLHAGDLPVAMVTFAVTALLGVLAYRNRGPRVQVAR